MVRVAMMGLLLAGCMEYGLKDDEFETLPPGLQEPVPGFDTGLAVGKEECNGKDDDGDGLVDENFRDSDGDGLADCIDDACEVADIPSMAVDVPEDCDSVVDAVVDPWNVAIEWSYNSSGMGVIVMPTVGNLTDDNGDGQIDASDIPDIVFTTWHSGGNTLVALSGDGSGVLFESYGYSGTAGIGIADVDVDGRPEIIALTSDRRVVAVDGVGNRKWVSNRKTLSMYSQPAIGDLDNDGDVEVVFDSTVVDGATGADLFDLSSTAAKFRTPVVADVDADGTMEIILGETVYSHTGSVEWSSYYSYGNFVAVANFDGDIGGESLFLGGVANVHDDDGTWLHNFSFPATSPGAPSIADFDGDGDVEVAISGGKFISVHEIDGTELWRSSIKDHSGAAGNSAYDVNGDGQYEVLYADETALRIYDGKDGTVLFESFDHASGTLWEYPVVADVDMDGSAEIVVASNGAFSGVNGITVFGHDGDGWARSGPTWATHDFAVTNIRPDGSVPSAVLPWTEHNVFRGRPAEDIPGTPDLVPVIGEICVASCVHGPIKVAWSVQNAGGLEQPAGLNAVLYGIGAGDEMTELARVTLPAIPPGTQLAGGEFELAPQDWEEGLRFVVDEPTSTHPNGVVGECNEDNNEAVVRENYCD